MNRKQNLEVVNFSLINLKDAFNFSGKPGILLTAYKNIGKDCQMQLKVPNF